MYKNNSKYLSITNLCDIHKVSKDYKEAVIVDLGGVLAHRTGRPKESFHERFFEDEIDVVIRDLVNLLYDSGLMIIILTGQWESSRDITERWLDHHGVKRHVLLMKNGLVDKRDTLDFKINIYNDLLKHLIPIKFVIEDREEIVESWRNLKVKCLQPASGQDREYYRQKSLLNNQKNNN